MPSFYRPGPPGHNLGYLCIFCLTAKYHSDLHKDNAITKRSKIISGIVSYRIKHTHKCDLSLNSYWCIAKSTDKPFCYKSNQIRIHYTSDFSEYCKIITIGQLTFFTTLSTLLSTVLSECALMCYICTYKI